MLASLTRAAIRIVSAGSCILKETFFKLTFQLMGTEAVSVFSVVAVSFNTRPMCVSESSTWLITAVSSVRSTPWLSRKKRPNTPRIFMPSMRSAELTVTCWRVISSTSIFPLNKGIACTCTLRLPSVSNVSGTWITSTSRTNGFNGKRRSIRPTLICIPVASDAYEVACFRKKFCTGGT